MSYVDKVVGAVAANRARLGRSTAPEKEAKAESDYDTELEALDLIRKLQEGIATEAEKRRASQIKEKITWRKNQQDFYAKLLETSGSNLRSRYTALVQLQKARETADRRYNEKVRSADTSITGKIRSDLYALRKGQDGVALAFDALNEPVSMGGKGKRPKIATDDPKYNQTLLEMFTMLNNRETTTGKGEIFVFQPGSDELLDIQATTNNLLKRNIDESPEYNNIQFHMKYYNDARRRRNLQEAQMNKEIQEGIAALNAAGAELDKIDQGIGDELKVKQSLNLFEEIDQKQKATFAYINDIEEKSELEGIIENAQKREYVLEESIELHEHLKSKRAGGGVKQKYKNIPRAIANPVFRAWAADYGWDRLGRVQMGEDGKPDLSTYVAGGDDVAALLAWGKQSQRRAGNYGTKGIRTGEVLRVELKDGTIVTGQRLRRHAADPFGAIRIVQPDGARVLLASEINEAIYLKRPEPDITRIDRRSMNIYDKEKAEYASLAQDALSRTDFEDRADTVKLGEDAYAVDEATGEYLTNEQLKARKSAAFDNSGYYGIKDGEGFFIVGPEGSVFGVDENGALTPVPPDQASQIVQRSKPNREDRLYVLNDVTGGAASFGEADLAKALEAGLPADLQVASMAEGETKQLIALAAEQETNAIPDESVVTKTKGPPDPFALRPGDTVDDSAGIRFRTLGEGEEYEFSDDELDSDTPVEDAIVAEAVDEPPLTVIGGDSLKGGHLGQPTGALPGTPPEMTLEQFAQLTAEQRSSNREMERSLANAIAVGEIEAPKDWVDPTQTAKPEASEDDKAKKKSRRDALRSTTQAARDVTKKSKAADRGSAKESRDEEKSKKRASKYSDQRERDKYKKASDKKLSRLTSRLDKIYAGADDPTARDAWAKPVLQQYQALQFEREAVGRGEFETPDTGEGWDVNRLDDEGVSPVEVPSPKNPPKNKPDELRQ